MHNPTISVDHLGDGEYTVTASCILPSTSTDLVVDAHTQERFAKAFRDIKRYTRFERGDDGRIHTAYDAQVGFVKFPMQVVKRVKRHDDKGAIIEFATEEGCLATFSGIWRAWPEGPGGSVVALEQTVSVPPWARVLPVKSAIHRRVANAMRDLNGLVGRHCPSPV